MIDYTAHQVSVAQEIAYRNETGDPLTEIVLFVPPNGQPNVFTLAQITLAGQTEPPLAVLESVRLTVPLRDALQPGCTQQIALNYTLSLPRMGSGYFPRQGYFGYSDVQLNLGHWMPVIAHRQDGDWITPPPINIGEQAVVPAGSFDVSVRVENAPDDLIVTGAGEVHQEGADWRFTLPTARDLVITMSDQYHHLETVTPSGFTVEVFTLDDAQPPANAAYDAPMQALQTAASALEMFNDLYGTYPYERYVVVESDFPDGMEFSGLVFVGGEWFRSYTGNPAGYLTLITAHETSHQWWYNIVANDQSAHPWLDEALATYSEYIFLQENYPDLTAWWWDFRVNAWGPQGNVDATVYQFDSVRGYINSVYLQGARLIHEIRQTLGNEVFFQWLHDYVEAMRGGVATPDDLWAALPQNDFERTEEARQAYLQQTQTLNQQ